MRRAVLAVVAAATLAVSPVRAADPEVHLYELPGTELARVRYAAGALERATQLQLTFEMLTRQADGWSGREQPLTLQLLDREQWQAVGHAMPYGVPERVSSSMLAVPAWGDDGTVDFWLGRLGGELPTPPAAPLRSSDEAAASLVPTDLLALVEGGRLLLEGARVRAAEAWIGELVAHSAAIGVLVRGRPASLAQAENLYRRLAAARRGRPLALAAFRAGVGFDDWLWFQTRFFEGARRVRDAEGRGATRAMVKLAGDDGLLTRRELLGGFAELERWLAESFAAPAAD